MTVAAVGAESALLDGVWAASGALALTGRARGAPLMAPSHITAGLRDLQAALRRWSAQVGRPVDVDVPALVGERAALAGLSRGGDRSCGRASRLLAAADGWVAVTLARPDDVAAVPAWFPEAGPPGDDPWPVVTRAVAARPAQEVVARAALLEIPAAVVPEPGVRWARASGLPVAATSVGRDPPPGMASASELVIVDLSSLWAGPLCTQLLSLAGANVVKVESATRPDGARNGAPAFFDLLNAAKRSVAVDLSAPGDVGALRSLIGSADVVVTASRPRALAQVGLDLEALIGAGRPRLWLSITGWGPDGAGRNRVAFGDDAAAGGGLVAWDAIGPCFCADAVADPLTGVVAAAAGLAALAAGGRWRIDVALAEVAAWVSAGGAGGAGDWRPAPPGTSAAPPRARPFVGRAPALGADNNAVLGPLDRWP